MKYLAIKKFSGQFILNMEIKEPEWEVGRWAAPGLFNFIDAIKYTKSTMMDDPCMAQWSHKFVYVCMCFEGFGGLFLLYYI